MNDKNAFYPDTPAGAAEVAATMGRIPGLSHEVAVIHVASFDAGWNASNSLWRYVAAGAFFLGLAIGWGAHPASAETLDGSSIRVIDGDTVALPCDPARGFYPGCAEKIRLEGIDAPEVAGHARCEAELAAAYRAKERLAQLLADSSVEITRTGKDRYGRTLGHLTADGEEVEEVLLAEGLALPWAPDRKAWAERCRHWCPGADRCER